jgi:hypothetical protein
MSTDANKLEHIQQKFASICFYCFFPHVPYSYTHALENLSLHSMHKWRHNLDALFFIHVYHVLQFCPSLLENASLRVPTCYVRDFSMFNVCTSVKQSRVAELHDSQSCETGKKWS